MGYWLQEEFFIVSVGCGLFYSSEECIDFFRERHSEGRIWNFFSSSSSYFEKVLPFLYLEKTRLLWILLIYFLILPDQSFLLLLLLKLILILILKPVINHSIINRFPCVFSSKKKFKNEKFYLLEEEHCSAIKQLKILIHCK